MTLRLRHVSSESPLSSSIRRSSLLCMAMFTMACNDAYVLFPDGAEDDAQGVVGATDTTGLMGPTRPGAQVILGTEPGQRVGSGALLMLGAYQTPYRDAVLLVGSPSDTQSGRDAGSVTTHSVTWAPEVSHSSRDALTGSPGARFGCAAHYLDEAALFAVGACARSTEAGEQIGAVYLFDHTTSRVGGSAPSVAIGRIEGASEYGFFGSSLASGDLDGDGTLDLVVSAPEADGGRGRLYLVDDIAHATWRTVDDLVPIAQGSAGEDHFGASLMIGGDVTGDGHDDLLACAPGWDVAGAPGAGACGVIAGGLPVLLGDSLDDAVVSVIYGNTPGDATGKGDGSIAIGPILSRGRTGIAIGLPGAHDGQGSVIIVGKEDLDGFVSSSAATLRIDGRGEFGQSLAILPGGGLLVGAPGFSSGGAAFGLLPANVRMPSGEAALAEDVADANWMGFHPGARFGARVAGGVDLDGDRWPDVAMSAPERSVGDEESVGQVVVTALPSGWPLEVGASF